MTAPSEAEGGRRVLDVPAAARALGVSEYVVRGMIANGELRAIRVGKKLLRIPVDAIEDLLSAKARPAGRAG